MRDWSRRIRARRQALRLQAPGRALARGYVPHIGWLWHAPGDQLMTLLRQGYFEAAEQAFVWLYLRRGDVVVDGGAHVGLYSVLAAQATHGRARVLSVEASPATADVLELNRLEHGVRGALARRAIWSTPGGTVRFDVEQPERAAYAHVSLEPTPGLVEVPATSLDALVAEHGFARAAFVKLDVEGVEPEALEGAAGLFARHAVDAWMIEFTEANLQRRGWSTVRLGDVVKGHGLVACELDRERLQLRPISTAETIWFANVIAVHDVDAVNARLRAAPERNREIARDVLARARACSRLEELEELDALRARAEESDANARWAREADARLAEARALADANARWAQEAEARLAEARSLADTNARRARDAEARAAGRRSPSENEDADPGESR